jgi:RNA-binding protein YlmH
MNKTEFINALRLEDTNVSSKLYEKVCITLKSSKTTYTNEFYSPLIWSKLESLRNKLNLSVSTYGIFEEAERRVIGFYTYDAGVFPIKLMVIQNDSKFTKLEHKDYLGAIMSLGFKREKIGDMIVEEDKCFCAIYEEIFTYVKENLSSIGRCPCTVYEEKDWSRAPKASYEDRGIITSSYRLDSIVSSITGLSRSKAVDIINGGKVFVNYLEICKKDYIIAENSVLTIRGYGKYRICENIGSSGSGRLKLRVKKYI